MSCLRSSQHSTRGQINNLILKEAARAKWERWARSHNMPYRQVQRARMLLALAGGGSRQPPSGRPRGWKRLQWPLGGTGTRHKGAGGVVRSTAEWLSLVSTARGGLGSPVAEIAGATAAVPTPLDPEPDGTGHGNFADPAATMAVGSKGPTPSHAYL